MLFVSCPFLKETPMRIDDSCIFAYEVKQKILSALVSSDFAHGGVMNCVLLKWCHLRFLSSDIDVMLTR
jgi:hypothetical protein